MKVWNTETGKNFANLSGHKGDVHSIKMAQDGTYAVSVGTDKKILLFDIRCMKAVAWMDASHFPEMHDLALFSQASSIEGQNAQNLSSLGGMPSMPQQPLVDSLNGFAAVGHNDGSVSIWNLNMRQCFAH